MVWLTWLLAGQLALPPGAWAVDLYAAETYRPLASDVKAFRVGDLLTVQVTESASAVTSADTNTARDTSGTAEVLFRGRSREMRGHVGHDFEGNAKTQRAGRLLAQLTVKVVAVQPNGDLEVEGQQELEINDEKQLIRLQGKVRRQDIGENNTVLSSRIADAAIHYAGDGVLTDGQRVGIVTRVLTWLGL
jgi:flagellar L-ring protein precursor FlgH